MPLNTPRGYTYPEYPDTQNFPAVMQDLAQDIDTDVQARYNEIADSVEYPSVLIHKTVAQSIPSNTNTLLTFGTEVYDNDNMANLGVSNTQITIQTAGVYIVSGSVTLNGNGNATPAAAALIAGIPVGVSHNLDNDKSTCLSFTTLHSVTAPPQAITLTVRHNSPAAVNAAVAQLSATRIS
ncbi:hypothetical protein L1085_009735 [Streptomyces sp. MSC1_001]|jgi:hypothetical protein|uniref:hypothetical protein n=1 Tax=Streptomyces sp. MSC1_001 TaxID=2909263 RepID=UPI00202EEBBE|nr:hypothetical protein [Streptomyces sp. MSC1_001]